MASRRLTAAWLPGKVSFQTSDSSVTFQSSSAHRYDDEESRFENESESSSEKGSSQTVFDIYEKCKQSHAYRLMVSSRSSVDNMPFWFTYQEVRNGALNFGRGLRDELKLTPGSEKQTTVGLYLPNCVEFVWVDYACAANSIPNVQLRSTFSPTILGSMIRHASINVLVSKGNHENLIEALEHINQVEDVAAPVRLLIVCDNISDKQTARLLSMHVKVIAIATLMDKGSRNVSNLSTSPLADDIATLCYSADQQNGTNQLSAIALSHRNVAANVNQLVKAFSNQGLRLGDTDRLLLFESDNYMHDRCIQLALFAVGGCVFYSDSVNLFSDARQQLPTLIISPLRFLKVLVAESSALAASSCFHQLFSCFFKQHLSMGERYSAVAPEWVALRPLTNVFGSRLRAIIVHERSAVQQCVLKKYASRFSCALVHGYGLSECVAFVTLTVTLPSSRRESTIKITPTRPSIGDSRSVASASSSESCANGTLFSVGQRFADCELLVLPLQGRKLLPIDATPVGVIHVRGVNVMRHALDKNQKLETLEDDSFLETGDVGSLDTLSGALFVYGSRFTMFELQLGDCGIFVFPERLECVYEMMDGCYQVFVNPNSTRRLVFALVVACPRGLPLLASLGNVSVSESESECVARLNEDVPFRNTLLHSLQCFGAANQLQRHEMIADFRIIEQAFTVDNGSLYPSGRKNRQRICQNHATVLQSIDDQFSGETVTQEATLSSRRRITVSAMI